MLLHTIVLHLACLAEKHLLPSWETRHAKSTGKVNLFGQLGSRCFPARHWALAVDLRLGRIVAHASPPILPYRQTPWLLVEQMVATRRARHKHAVLTELNIVITLFIISSLANRAELCNFVPE